MLFIIYLINESNIIALLGLRLVTIFNIITISSSYYLLIIYHLITINYSILLFIIQLLIFRLFSYLIIFYYWLYIIIILLGLRYLASSIPLISLAGVAIGVGIISAFLVFSTCRNPIISNVLIR